MQSRILLYSTDARQRLQRGIDALANMVNVTLGPRGRNVVIDRKFGGPIITKDGVTVAKEVFMKDPVENIGAQMLKQVASKTADVAGDGTTTATVLAQAMIQEGVKIVAAGANPMDVKRGMDIAVKAALEKLKAISKPVKDKNEVVDVGTIAANNDIEIGTLIADAMEQVGKNGVITVEDAKGTETKLEIVEGMQFDRGYLSAYFITNPGSMQAELENARLLLVGYRISISKDIVPILERTRNDGQSLLIVAADVDGECLSTLVVNKMKGVIKACAVKSPGYGERQKDLLDDIAIMTGGRVVSPETGLTLANLTNDDLGTAEKVTINRERTVVISGKGDAVKIKERIQMIKTQIDNATSDYDKEKYQERLAKLSGGIGVLRVGAATETESKEKKMRIEDALHATRAAVDEGVVPGGGVAYVLMSLPLESLKATNGDQQIGIQIVRNALRRPLINIAANAGQTGEVVLNQVMQGPRERLLTEEKRIDYGFNALTNVYSNLYEDGVIDPTKVVRTAVENASSIAGLFLTTEGVIAESLEEKAEQEKLMNQEPMY